MLKCLAFRRFCRTPVLLPGPSGSLHLGPLAGRSWLPEPTPVPCILAGARLRPRGNLWACSPSVWGCPAPRCGHFATRPLCLESSRGPYGLEPKGLTVRHTHTNIHTDTWRTAVLGASPTQTRQARLVSKVGAQRYPMRIRCERAAVVRREDLTPTSHPPPWPAARLRTLAIPKPLVARTPPHRVRITRTNAHARAQVHMLELYPHCTESGGDGRTLASAGRPPCVHEKLRRSDRRTARGPADVRAPMPRGTPTCERHTMPRSVSSASQRAALRMRAWRAEYSLFWGGSLGERLRVSCVLKHSTEG